MSDETETPGTDTSKSKDESDFDREQKKGPVLPVNETLFEFLDELFTGEGEFPEVIKVHVAAGRNKDQYGTLIKQFPFKSGNTKPTRERLVKMSNDIAHRVRIFTDVRQRETTFMIGALNHLRGDDFYDILPMTVKPRKTWARGENGDLPPNGDDDEDAPFANRYNTAVLGHFTQFFSLIGGMTEGLIERSDKQAAAAMADAERMRARYIELLEVNMRLAQADDERKERIAKSEMWRQNINKGLDMAWGLLPPMLTSFKGNGGGAWQPGAESGEAYTLREYFKPKEEGGRLTKTEFELIFGEIDGGKVISPGVLSLDQGKLLADIASKEVNPEMLDLLLPGGALQISNDQIGKIVNAGIPIEALAPLKALLEVRLARREKQQAQATTP